MVEKLTIKTKEANGLTSEIRSYAAKIHELENDNDLLFKKINDMQQSQLKKMDEINTLYDEVRVQSAETLAQSTPT